MYDIIIGGIDGISQTDARRAIEIMKPLFSH